RARPCSGPAPPSAAAPRPPERPRLPSSPALPFPAGRAPSAPLAAGARPDIMWVAGGGGPAVDRLWFSALCLLAFILCPLHSGIWDPESRTPPPPPTTCHPNERPSRGDPADRVADPGPGRGAGPADRGRLPGQAADDRRRADRQPDPAGGPDPPDPPAAA